MSALKTEQMRRNVLDYTVSKSCFAAVVVAAVVGCFACTGCSKKNGEGKKEETVRRPLARKVVDRRPLPFPTVDSKAELEALQGTWKVSDPGLTMSAPATWTFAKNQLTRKSAAKSLACRVTFPTPGRMVCVASHPSGLKKLASFAYARNGDKVYLSGGEAGVKIGHRWIATLHDGILALGDGKCVFYKFRLNHKQVETGNPRCKYVEKKEKGMTVLNYEIPDPTGKGKPIKGVLRVDGVAVVSKSVAQALKVK